MFIIYGFPPPVSDQTPMIRSASDWLRYRMSTLPPRLVVKSPPNSHTSLARIRKNSFTHAQTATNHSWHPLVCAVCVAGSQPPMISCIVSVCRPSHGMNLSPLQGDRKQSAHHRPNLLNGHLKIDSVWFLG